MAKNRDKQKFIFVLFLCLIYLSGCSSSSSLVSKGLLPEVKAHRPPQFVIGKELVLLDSPATASASLISKDRKSHVFATDKNGQLYYIEILGDKIVTREALGLVNIEREIAIDAVEYPTGVLRVLAGENQYIRASSAEGWREMKGNRCMKFLPAGDNLFCAFVAKNDEKISAPKRTDITFGWLVFFPIVSWSNKQAAKLVLAQELESDWAVRAVLDPDTELDANIDFVVGIDNRNNFHFLYYTSTGGGAFGFLVSPLGIGSFDTTKKIPWLRYGHIPLERLLHFATSAPQSSNQNQNPRDWLPIEGYDVSMSLPFVVWGWNNKVKGYPIFRPLRFIVDSTSGELQGLKHTNPGANHVRTENRELLFDGSDHGWLGVVLQDGNWAETCDIITAKDLPDDSSYWPIDGGTLIRNNSLNDIYVLLKSCKSADSCCMTCFVKNKLNWSAPFILGSTKASPVISTSSFLKYSRTIAVDDYGRAFAAWVDAEGRFVGRWLTSHQGGNLQGERQN